MKYIAIVLLALIVWEAKVGGVFSREDEPAKVEARLSTATPTQTEVSPIAESNSNPPCALNWDLEYTPDNGRALLSCYKAREASGIIEPFCAPAGSVWMWYTNSAACWELNGGTQMPTLAPPETTPVATPYP